MRIYPQATNLRPDITLWSDYIPSMQVESLYVSGWKMAFCHFHLQIFIHGGRHQLFVRFESPLTGTIDGRPPIGETWPTAKFLESGWNIDKFECCKIVHRLESVIWTNTHICSMRELGQWLPHFPLDSVNRLNTRFDHHLSTFSWLLEVCGLEGWSRRRLRTMCVKDIPLHTYAGHCHPSAAKTSRSRHSFVRFHPRYKARHTKSYQIIGCLGAFFRRVGWVHELRGNWKHQDSWPWRLGLEDVLTDGWGDGFAYYHCRSREADQKEWMQSLLNLVHEVPLGVVLSNQL